MQQDPFILEEDDIMTKLDEVEESRNIECC
jgi:hypothetical protein